MLSCFHKLFTREEVASLIIASGWRLWMILGLVYDCLRRALTRGVCQRQKTSESVLFMFGSALKTGLTLIPGTGVLLESLVHHNRLPPKDVWRLGVPDPFQTLKHTVSIFCMC